MLMIKKVAVANQVTTSSSTYLKDQTQFVVPVGSQTTGYALTADGRHVPIPITTSRMPTGHLLPVSHMIQNMKSGMLVCLM